MRAMFVNLRTGTKLLLLCATFLISVAVPIHGLVTEKQIAIDFARKELIGSQYLASVRDAYPEIVTLEGGSRSPARAQQAAASIAAGIGSVAASAADPLQASTYANALATTLRRIGASTPGPTNTLIVEALSTAQALIARIGDDSNLALDPDLDTYYLQNIIVRKLPAIVLRLGELQGSFSTDLAANEPSTARTADLLRLQDLARATADEMQENLQAAYRGNPDGGVKRAVHAAFTTMSTSMESYFGALHADSSGVDARDTLSYQRFHLATMANALDAWRLAQSELDRLLRLRIDRLLGKMRFDLALISAFAGLSIIIAFLTHRHIVRPLQRLESVASTVRRTRDYSVRADYTAQDEIGRVTTAFNDMLSELAAARARETAERVELARVTRLTTMGEMAASIAHEVNQPLAAIVANANAGLRWLARASPDLEKVQAILQRVVRDGHRASDVVSSVRAMVKRDLTQKIPVLIDDLIEHVVGLLQDELRAAQIELSVDCADNLPRVLADRVQLQQVLLNLVTNAIEALRTSQAWPRSLSIKAAASEGKRLSVNVEDSGPGIEAKDRDRIFEPFFTTKSGGMGLGLSICRSIIEAHGGTLEVSPRAPHGTVFAMVLPVAGCEADNVP
jgi:signal transduction histidine kinase